MSDKTSVTEITPAAATAVNKQEVKNKPRSQPSSRPVMRRSVEIGSEHALKVYHRAFDRCGYDTYSITVVLGVQLTNLDLIAAEKAIKKIFLDTREAMEKKIKEIDAKLEEFLVDRPGYTNPKTVNAKLTTPSQNIFLENILIMDKLMSHVDAQWFAGMLEAHQRKDETYEWQQRLIKDGQRIKNLSQQLGAGLKKKKAEQSETPKATKATKASLKKVAGSDINE